MPENNDSRWFTLAIPSRWPLAVVIAAWSIASASTQILRQPITIGLPLGQPFPVRLVGGVTVEEIKAHVSVKSEGSIAIEASEGLPVQGQVSVNEVTTPVKVQGVDEGPVLVGTSDENQLTVGGAVEVTEVGGRINVRLRDAAQLILPIP